MRRHCFSRGYDIDNPPQWTKTVSPTGLETRIDFYLSASGAKAVQISAGPNPRVVIYAGAYEAEYQGTISHARNTAFGQPHVFGGRRAAQWRGRQLGNYDEITLSLAGKNLFGD